MCVCRIPGTAFEILARSNYAPHFKLPHSVSFVIAAVSFLWQDLSGYLYGKCKIKFFAINSKHHDTVQRIIWPPEYFNGCAWDMTHTHGRIRFRCILVPCFRSKVAPFWMWRMYVMGEAFDFMDIVVLWWFGRWIGDTKAFSIVNWRLDAERVSSLPLLILTPSNGQNSCTGSPIMQELENQKPEKQENHKYNNM